MARIAGSITIDAPVEEVFDLVADERNEPKYNPRILRAEKVTEGPVGKGSRFVAEPKSMGAKGAMTMDVLEYERPHRLHNVIRSSYLQVEGTLTFAEVAEGTRLSWDWRHGLGRPDAPAVASARGHRPALGTTELGGSQGVRGGGQALAISPKAVHSIVAGEASVA